MSEETKKAPAIRFQGFTDDWEQRKLGELMDISSASRVHKNEWTKSGIRFFRSSDVVASFNKKKNTEAFISHELYEKLSSKSGKVCQGDILITGGGSIGIPYLIKDEEPLYFKDADLIWLKNSGKLNGYFLFTYFVTNGFRQYLESISHIGTISHYTIEQAKVTPISLPNKNEQDKIGVFFDKLDNTIALHQRKLTLLKQLKQTYLQALFPQSELNIPTLRFAPFSDSWEHRKVSSLAKETFGGGTPKTGVKKYWKGSSPWIQSSDLTTNQLHNVQPTKFITEEAIKQSATHNVPGNSIAIVTRVGVGKLALMRSSYSTSQDFLSLSNLNVDAVFGVYCLYKMLQREVNNIQGTSIKGITKADLLGKCVSVPTKVEEQVKIGAFFKKIDDTIDFHESKLKHILELKKAFLEKMFL